MNNTSEPALWEILVPTVRNDGRPFYLRYHKVWDAKILEMSGGLTIMKPAVGQWVDPKDDKLYKDRTIPVRFIATEEQATAIVDMSCLYYEQEAMLCYRIADKVILRTKEQANGKKTP